MTAKRAAQRGEMETDPVSSPMKAEDVAEFGICGVAAAVADAVYSASGVRIRDYPLTLDKLIAELPDVGWGKSLPNGGRGSSSDVVHRQKSA